MPPFRLIPSLTDTRMDADKYADVWQAVNDQAAIMIQIESLEGLENLDAILTEVPEIDAVWIGSLDMRVSMGLPANGGMGGPEPEWAAAVQKYLEITDKHNKPRGGMALGPDEMFNQMQANLDFIVGAAEIVQLMSLQQDLQRMRDMTAYRIKGAEKEVTVSNGKPANGSA